MKGSPSAFLQRQLRIIRRRGLGTPTEERREDAGRQKVCPIPLPGLELPERNENCEIAGST